MDFREGEIAGVEVVLKRRYEDERGWLSELFRQDEKKPDVHPAMSYVSVVPPGVVRGPHLHKEQTDYFVFMLSEFKVYLWDERKDSPTYRNKKTIEAETGDPVCVLIPPGVVHAYRNIGNDKGLVINFPDKLYAGWGRKEPVDEVRYEGNPEYGIE